MSQTTISRSAPGDVQMAGSTVSGYAARFDTLSGDLGGFVERVAPGSFTKTISEGVGADRDIYALFNHDQGAPLARTKDGSLSLETDETGLRYSFEIPDTAAGEELHRNLAAGLLGGASFAGRLMRDVWHERSDPVLHEVVEVALRDVGPVTFPAYQQTEPTLRSLDPVLRDLAIARSLDLAEVVEAIRAGSLGAILAGEHAEQSADAPQRHRFAHLL